jgi:hypothetical protein
MMNRKIIGTDDEQSAQNNSPSTEVWLMAVTTGV